MCIPLVPCQQQRCLIRLQNAIKSGAQPGRHMTCLPRQSRLRLVPEVDSGRRRPHSLLRIPSLPPADLVLQLVQAEVRCLLKGVSTCQNNRVRYRCTRIVPLGRMYDTTAARLRTNIATGYALCRVWRRSCRMSWGGRGWRVWASKTSHGMSVSVKFIAEKVV